MTKCSVWIGIGDLHIFKSSELVDDVTVQLEVATSGDLARSMSSALST